MRGSCLCGGVRFEVARAVGPFELCHCRRCRKASGASHVAGLGVLVRDYTLLSGAELIRSYEAPVLREPPAYRASFCTRCGSPVPAPRDGESWFEIPAGLLDDDPGLRPDRHIFVEWLPDWDAIHDDMPQLDEPALVVQRSAAHAEWQSRKAARQAAEDEPET
jgi:hypothetical protein